jgi:hypothetical protein
MARKEKKYHYIYKTTNLINGKYYIGMHSTSNLGDGYMGSGKRLRYSIRKHGEQNHKVEILEFVNSREELVLRETEIVNLNEIAKVECMNLRVGGTGEFSREQQKLNAEKSNSKQKILRENDSEWVIKISGIRSDSQKKVYSEGKSGLCDYNWNGKKHSDETKHKISDAMKGKGVGKANSQYGTCWVTNGKEVKKIKKEDLDSWLNKGWIKGRKKINNS